MAPMWTSLHTHTHTHTHNTHTKEYYSSGERRNMLFVKTWMDFEGIMLSEIADDR